MLACKFIAATVVCAAYLLFGAGCVTVGYDFLKQQATVTYNHQPKTDGFKK